jgi:WD40 repeat protein
LLLLAALAATVASAQSPGADISWLAGGHLSPIASVAYSPDGAVLASSGYFGDTLKLWNAADGRMVRTFGNTVGSSFIFGPNFSRFIDSSGNVMARVKWSGAGLMPSGARLWQVNVNQAVWAAGL